MSDPFGGGGPQTACNIYQSIFINHDKLLDNSYELVCNYIFTILMLNAIRHCYLF